MNDWRHRAECARRDLDFDLFFPEEEGVIDFRVIQACRSCPVRRACLEYALECEERSLRDFRSGIWGGMTPRQRTNLVNRGFDTTIFSHASQSYKKAMRRART
jgi:WhiB family transcriptional regulator, redox-sensing transcriptional regulator